MYVKHVHENVAYYFKYETSHKKALGEVTNNDLHLALIDNCDCAVNTITNKMYKLSISVEEMLDIILNPVRYMPPSE